MRLFTLLICASCCAFDALNITGPATNKPQFSLTLRNVIPTTNNIGFRHDTGKEYWLDGLDWSVTNLQIELSHKPTVTETNGKWILTFPK